MFNNLTSVGMVSNDFVYNFSKNYCQFYNTKCMIAEMFGELWLIAKVEIFLFLVSQREANSKYARRNSCRIFESTQRYLFKDKLDKNTK